MSYVFEADWVGITLGSVHEESLQGEFPKIGKHIFLKEKAKIGGLELADDGAKRWQDHTDVFAKQIEEWERDVKAEKATVPQLKW